MAPLVPTGLLAQAPQNPRPRPVVLRSHDPDLSMHAFMACDLDRDDRITFREASLTLGVTAPVAFRLWDRKNQGWIHFPDFDRVFRQRVRDGLGLTLLGPAAEAIGQPLPAPSPTLSVLFRLLDLDQDGYLLPREWLAAPPELASLLARIPQGFFGLDRDRDGRLSPAELSALALLYPGLTQAGPDQELLRATLPPELQRADRDRDQHIQKEELEALLAGMDPGLALWVDPIFRHLDRNGDGRISPREARALIGPARPSGS